MEPNLLAKEVQAMRELQKQYFHLSALAKKQGYHPDVVAEKRKVLEQSKQQEKKVDRLCVEALEPKEEPKLFDQ